MAREKWERRAYEKMALLKDEENAMEVKAMSKDEEKKQIELFRKRLQKEDSTKIKKKRYRKLAAAVAILVLLPSSVYAATHYKSIKEVWLDKFTWGENKLELAKIHDKNWEREKQNETVYEAFGVRFTIYSCFFDQEDRTIYLSYKTEDISKISRYVEGQFGTTSFSNFVENDKEAICVDIVPVDKNGKVKDINRDEFICGSFSWTGAGNGLIYAKLSMEEYVDGGEFEGFIPKIEFTKRTIDEYSSELDDWKIVETKHFDMPKAEHLKVRHILAEEDKSLKLKISQQSLYLYADSKKNKEVDIPNLKDKKAKIYTKDGVFELEGSWGYSEEENVSVEKEYTLAGADLSQIEKIEIGEYTFKLPQS